MWKRLRKLKKLWDLSSKTDEELKALLGVAPSEIEPDGDGHAVFFSEGTEAEYEQYRTEQELGWKGFFDKIRKLL